MLLNTLASRVFTLAITSLLWACAAGAAEAPAHDAVPKGSPRTAITHARVFDGERVWTDATVIFADGLIEKIAATRDSDLSAIDPFDIVDGRGQTLLPGLLDAHFHTSGEIQMLQDALRFGATTVFDLYTPESLLVNLREAVTKAPTESVSDFFTAGQCANVRGGHGTRSADADAVAGADDAERWTLDRVKFGVDYIKIVIEPGFFPGQTTPTVDAATVRALVEAAHRHGLLAIAHVSRTSSAQIAVDAGVDILAHTWSYGAPADLIESIARHGIYVMPTLSVYDGLYSNAGTIGMMQDLRLRNYMTRKGISELTTLFDLPANDRTSKELQVLTGRLYRHHIKLLAGTDADNGGVWPGASLHRELELLVQSGMKPIDALRSATSVTAEAFRKPDRGRIAPGKRADLLLVGGDPTKDIRDTRNIVAIWKAGQRVDREAGLDARAP